MRLRDDACTTSATESETWALENGTLAPTMADPVVLAARGVGDGHAGKYIF